MRIFHWYKAALYVPLAAFIAASWAVAPSAAHAQDWPSRPVTLMQTFAAGGMMDFAARSIAQELTATLGQTLVVETRQGGGGVIGLMSVAKAPPDGYTFVVTAIGPMVFRPMIDKTIGFDPDKDFEPVILIGETPNGIMAAPRLGVSTIGELRAYAARQNNRLNIGHPGPGTMGHYCGVLLAEKIGVEGNFIAYRGAAPIITDLLGGQIELATPAFGPSSTTVKILAVSGEQRLDTVPDVPTLKEVGVDMTCATWIGIFAPAGTPQPIVARLNAAIDAFLRKPETRKAFGDMGFTPLGGPPQRVRKQMAADRKLWGPLITRLEGAK